MLDSVDCRIDLGLSQQVCCRAKKILFTQTGEPTGYGSLTPIRKFKFLLGVHYITTLGEMCIRYNSSFDCMLFLLGSRILHILASFCFP